MSSQIRGVVPPLAIPLKNGELDVASLERHINRMIGAGLNGLFVSGSTGEVAFSTSERRQQIQREVVRIVDGRVPLLVGVIDTETERVIENIKAVEEIGGALGVVATAPFYALGGQAEIEKHFRILKENTNLELWAYDIPVCVHTKLQNDLVLRLGKEGVLDGVKDSSGDDVGFRWLRPSVAGLRARRLGSRARRAGPPCGPHAHRSGEGRSGLRRWRWCLQDCSAASGCL